MPDLPDQVLDSTGQELFLRSACPKTSEIIFLASMNCVKNELFSKVYGVYSAIFFLFLLPRSHHDKNQVFYLSHFVCDEMIDQCRTSIFSSGQVKLFSLLVHGQVDFCNISTALSKVCNVT